MVSMSKRLRDLQEAEKQFLIAAGWIRVNVRGKNFWTLRGTFSSGEYIEQNEAVRRQKDYENSGGRGSPQA